MMFKDRRDAGRKLARALERFKSANPVVLALPRGGVPVGFEVAEHLRAPLDLLLVRKIGAPGHEELARRIHDTFGFQFLLGRDEFERVGSFGFFTA